MSFRCSFRSRTRRAVVGLRVVAIALAVLAASCDYGLSPEMGLVGFEGAVTVTSTWPPGDSLFTLRVVAARQYPPKDIIAEYVGGRLLISNDLVHNQSSQSYRITQGGLSGVYEYVAVAQQYGPNVFTDWRVVGVYAPGGDPAQPAPLDFGSGRFLHGIDITVDFVKLPPQPF